MDERADERPGRAQGEDPLEDRLRGLFAGAEPPEEVRRRLEAEAARRFGRARRWRVLRERAVPIGAAAAAVLLVTTLAVLRGGGAARDEGLDVVARAEPAADGVAADVRDLDGSGRVDAYDAYLLARAVRRGETDGLPDVDGDGRVTRADAERIAAAAVEVTR